MVENSIFYNEDAFGKLSEIIDNESEKFILCDTQTKKYCLPYLSSKIPTLTKATILSLPKGENSKEWESAIYVWDKLLKKNADKHSILLNVDGGVVCDLGGFVASVFKRGITYVNIPTSLMAQVDAAIGGKTAINFNGIKNQIGSFYLPQYVFIFNDLLLSLPKKHYLSAFAEMLKHALIADKKYWEALKQIKNTKTIINHQHLIQQSINIKANIVAQDFKDCKERKKLNFGHTIGHAIEAELLKNRKNILHGEAIAWGMLVEAHLSWQKGFLSSQDLEEINAVIRDYYYSLPTYYINENNLIKLIKNDKKRISNNSNITLLKGIGCAIINQNCSDSEIRKAVRFTFQ